MWRRGALFVGIACALLGGGLLASAIAGSPVDACATRPNLLGLSRVVEVDTSGGPLFARGGGYDFLADGEVVLTFDDGPLRPYTQAVLKALDQHCTKATFFMVGRMAVADPDMVREVARRGHTVAAHTFSHAKLQGIEPAKAKEEIELGFSAISEALQTPAAPFFRFPYLRPTPAAMDYLKSRNIASFAIDVDSRDFRTRDGETVEKTVLAQLAARRKGILLFHDIQPSTAHSIKGILDALKSRGFKVVHMVPKAPLATLAEYDAQAKREIAHNHTTEKKPLAARSVVAPQSGGAQKVGEQLPWAHAPAGSQQATAAKASIENASVPWYKQWFMP
jgi:peptidoglycan/xylan/chitin deacetylase (PgdA/CDA1 family)